MTWVGKKASTQLDLETVAQAAPQFTGYLRYFNFLSDIDDGIWLLVSVFKG